MLADRLDPSTVADSLVDEPLDAGSSLSAVLFDMDGLLVDTERDWYAVESAIMTRLGASWGPEHQQHLVGGPMGRTVRYMLDLSGASSTPEMITQLMLDGMAERLRRGVVWRPGAEDLLVALSEAGVPCALVSASFRILVDAVLDSVGHQHFRTSVAGDEVARTKPDPEPYLLAANRLGACPARCVVLEDSLPGLAAAEAAGCVAVGVPHVVDLPAAPGRTVVGSLSDLTPALLDAMVARRVGERSERHLRSSLSRSRTSCR